MDTAAADTFQVQCGYGGTFAVPPEGWPLCDSVAPLKCENYPEPPEIVELVNSHPQLPGGKIFYRCKEEGFITNIGPLVEVECVKYLNGTVDFQLPNGWKNLKCRSQAYPHFKYDPCLCPGDDGVTEEQHIEILNVCYENETLHQAASMNVPMKKRCGVGSLDNITLENICYCSERSEAATDFSIWSKVELTNFDFHLNFTEPATIEFKQVQKLFEKEVSFYVSLLVMHVH